MMRPTKYLLIVGVLAALAAGMLSARAQTIWNGPAITFSHTPQNGLADQITPGVAITRGFPGGLYNSVTETSANPGTSPADTLWAVGFLTNYNNLTFGPCPLEAHRSPPGFVGTTFVVWLTNEDIYLQLTLTGWGGSFMSGNTTFSYTRTTAPTAAAPTVSINSPLPGAVFSAPANIPIFSSVSGGTVTNVQFFANTTSLGSVTAAPFNLTSSSLAAGSYGLTAVATAGGLSGTSSVVNVTVVTPVAITLSSPSLSGGQFSLNYSANAGLSYFIQGSSDCMNWTSLKTNVASANPSTFSVPATAPGLQFYRVGRLPNP